jgi:hypothetical protein
MTQQSTLACPPLVPSRALGRVTEGQPPDVLNRYLFNDLFSAVWLSEAIVACVRLQLPDAFDEHPMPLEMLAKQRQLQPETLARLLRALVRNGIFAEPTPGVFVHTELSRQLRADHPYTYRPMALLWGHPNVRRSWEHLHDAMANGNSGILNSTGNTLYERLMVDQDMALAFNGAMISNSGHASQSLAKSLNLQNRRSVVDLAGGIGTLLVTLLQVHPHLEGVLYELPYLQEPATAYLAKHGVAQRARFEAGDFTQQVPAGAEVYLVKNTLWNFPDPQALLVLQAVRKALGDGDLYIIEYLVEPENAAWTSLWDLQMLNLPGGRARSVAEYQQLLAAAGLSLRERLNVEDQIVLRATVEPG